MGLVGISVPSFWLGTLFILLFALVFGLLPPGGYIPLTLDPVDNLRHMILPAIALGAAVAAVITRMTRSAMLDVIGQDYIRTALSKGLSPRTVYIRHALRNAMIPILTVAGIQAGYLLGGSVVIEQVFGWPGVGSLIELG
jgi:peptide/nickel transport system permease protein